MLNIFRRMFPSDLDNSPLEEDKENNEGDNEGGATMPSIQRADFDRFFDRHYRLTSILGLQSVFPRVTLPCENDFWRFYRHISDLSSIYLQGITAFTNLIFTAYVKPVLKDTEEQRRALGVKYYQQSDWSDVLYVEDYVAFEEAIDKLHDNMQEHLLNIFYPEESINLRISLNNRLVYRKDHLYMLASGYQELKDLTMKEKYALIYMLYSSLSIFDRDPKGEVYELPIAPYTLKYLRKFDLIRIQGEIVDGLYQEQIKKILNYVRHYSRLYHDFDNEYIHVKWQGLETIDL